MEKQHWFFVRPLWSRCMFLLVAVVLLPCSLAFGSSALAVESCTVTLYSGDLDKVIDETIVTKGSAFVLPDIPDDCLRYLYPVGWTEEDVTSGNAHVYPGEIYLPGEKIIVQSDVTLYATGVRNISQYTVSSATLQLISGYSPASANRAETVRYSVERGSDFTLPDCPFEVEGMVFDGWTKGSAGETIRVGSSSSVYALWKYEDNSRGNVLYVFTDFPMNVEVNGKGIDTFNPKTYRAGETVDFSVRGVDKLELTLLVDGKREVMKLVDGFYCYSFKMPARDVEVQLVYQPVVHRMTIRAGDGSGSMKEVYSFDGAFSVPGCSFTAPAGKVFDYWLVIGASEDVRLGAYHVEPGVVMASSSDQIAIAIWKDAEETVHVHHAVKVTATTPTCTEPGTEDYWECTECGKLFADDAASKEISAPFEIPAAHEWSEWKVTTKPTATAEGQKTRTCAVCGETETEGLPATKGEVTLVTPGEPGEPSAAEEEKTEQSGLPWWAWTLIGVGGLGVAGAGTMAALNARARSRAKRQAAARRQAAHRAQAAYRPASVSQGAHRPSANMPSGAGEVTYRNAASHAGVSQRPPAPQPTRPGAHAGAHVRTDQGAHRH